MKPTVSKVHVRIEYSDGAVLEGTAANRKLKPSKVAALLLELATTLQLPARAAARKGARKRK